MDGVFLTGRILFVAIFLISAVRHFTMYKGMVAYSKQMGVPLPEITVPATGILVGVAGTLLALGAWGDLASLLLAAFLLPTAFFMHRFWGVSDPMTAANQQAHFMKNIALAGAALVTFFLFQQFGDSFDLTVTGPLFDF